MFRAKSAEESNGRAPNGNLTGLERAKLERAHQPPAPQPVAASAPPPPPSVAPAPPKATVPPPPRVEMRPVIRPPVSAPVQAVNTNAQLIVGSGVTLKGDILNCDLLKVEGNIEGDVKARRLVVAASGTLVGTAEIDDAEIEGRFDGTLSAVGLLVVRSTGRASGKFAYADIEIERGGQIAGDIQVGKNGQPRAINPKRSAPEQVRSEVSNSGDATMRSTLWPQGQ